MRIRLNALPILAVPSATLAHDGHHAQDSASTLLMHALGDPAHLAVVGGIVVASGIVLAIRALRLRRHAGKQVRP